MPIVRKTGGLADTVHDYHETQGHGNGISFYDATPYALKTSIERALALYQDKPTWRAMQERGMRTDRHFGSRIVEGRDGYLYLSIGDRGERPSAQDLSPQAGSIVRVARDGSVPADNPFVGQSGIQPEIWSYGHRNPQGMTLAPDGTLLTAEHGARGGRTGRTPVAPSSPPHSPVGA